MENIESLSILYQDDYLVAIDKPASLLVHRSPIDKRETRFAVQLLRDQVGQHVYPVHRLDRPTSGILLFAFSGDLAGMIGKQMMQKQVAKTYHAVVRGFIVGSGCIDYALSFKRDKIADKHRGENIAPQPATTDYQALARYELPYAVGRYQSARYSYVRLHPFSGRKHQLRRHLAHIHHPIVGDTTHGDGKQNKFARNQFGFENLALSCTQLGIQHPVTKKWLSITCGINPALEKLLHNWKEFEFNE
ncbi:tRNA pseudouridine(65) synthase TruC [Alteromonas pelagimontana]|uniref:tRNA pseudouridine synthase C n=1 Tax=Alteromonas pelagimontana TaxID=1858656 RepID=A0A6M4MFL4_9ALTE|nr:pseudouridine synthase [Alteromonas pelagimontana]QJR81767.1 tRNA pseudouridine(65) synthase TruC [Alteromonas pelagimontana]